MAPPLCVGISLLVGICWSAGISGACLNPAVGIANSLFQYAMRNAITKGSLKLTLNSLWIYILGPATGGLLAGAFQLLNGKASVAMTGVEKLQDLQTALINN